MKQPGAAQDHATNFTHMGTGAKSDIVRVQKDIPQTDAVKGPKMPKIAGAKMAPKSGLSGSGGGY